ncbi:MAG TPA: carboxypeptidase regulatory-like domain-containing protein [Nitrospiria bacterium]|nr:carboxypeptidase regulatory-like domain-containing protein [Nitrospiria bacterium]
MQGGRGAGNGRLLAVAGLLVGTLLANPSFAYQEIVVQDGGSVTGRVQLNGTPPPARIFHLVFSPNMAFCGKISDGAGNRLLREFRVAKDGAFEGVVVAVVGVEKGKRFDYTPTLDIENCRISPLIMPVRNGRPLKMINKDDITHDVQAYSMRDDFAIQMFNKPMIPNMRAEKTVRMRKGHYVFHTQCGVHDFMQSWGMAVGNPYFAVTAADGTFTIPDLPPGQYDVLAWHPHLPVQSAQVTVSAKDRAAVDFMFEAKDVDIPLHDLQERYRLDTALDARPMPEPTLERQVQ